MVCKEYLTQQEASKYLGISVKTFIKNIEPELPYIRLGRKKLFKRSDIDELRFGTYNEQVKAKQILQDMFK